MLIVQLPWTLSTKGEPSSCGSRMEPQKQPIIDSSSPGSRVHSDMLQVKDRNTVPPGYFRYRDPDTNHVIREPYYHRLKGKAREYRNANNLPIGLLWDEQFEAIVCKESPDICAETRTESELTPVEKATNFAKAMLGWALSGFKVVSMEQYVARRTICRGDDTHPRCPHWRGERQFGFIACAKCGCAKLKLFLPESECLDNRWGKVKK